MIMKKNILIIVANSHKAIIFKKEFQSNLDNHKIATLILIKELRAELDELHEKPGRTFNSTGKIRHGVEPHTDRRDIEKQNFANKIIENIQKESCDEIIIFAADKMLNILTNGFTKEISNKIKNKINKNILDFKMTEMREYILRNL